MPSLTMNIRHGGDLEKKILDAVRERITASKNKYDTKYDAWRKADDKAVGYIHEKDADRLRRNERESKGVPQYTTIHVPYSYGVLMSSHTYWTTVFLSRAPVLQFTGRHGETEQQTQALEAMIDYQVQVGEMMVPWYCWLFDVGKYGVGIIGLYWDEQFSNVSEIVEKEELFLGIIKTGNTKRVKQTRRVRGYTGNKIYNIRPYEFYPDPRVTMMDFQKGEFCAVARQLGWNTILRRKAQGYYTNIDEVKPGRVAGQHDKASSPRIEEPDDTSIFTLATGKNTTKEKGNNQTVPVFECYVDLVPKEWKLGEGDLPEKWVFTVDAKFTVCIGAQPLGANHDKFPFSVIELEPEAYSIVSRGMPEILEPVQNTIDWLINSHFYNVRKILNGQYVVDPSRVTMLDLLDPQPGGIVRLKPAGYGNDPRTTYAQMEASDVTQTHLRDMQAMLEIGQRAVGVNDQLMGVLQGSGRKTAAEIRSASTFGVNRLKTNAEFFSAMGWSPMGQMMVQNSQQYYDAPMKFKLVGDLAEQAGEQFVNVAPDDIGGFYDFVPVDGVLPVDRFAQANLWKEIFVSLKQMPEVAAGYDMIKMFAWVAQLGGLKNINQFKIKAQVAPPGAIGPQVQAGNLIPLPNAGGMPNMPKGPGNPLEPRQIPGMGATA